MKVTMNLAIEAKQLVKISVLTLGILSTNAFSAEPPKELNLYSARHYQTDEALYSDFTKKTGIKINRIEANDNSILERIKSEGDKSRADVILLVDAARLWRAQMNQYFAPIQSKYLEERIPANLRAVSESGGIPWFGFSTRARIIVFNKATVNKSDVDTYEKLADPINKGRVCTRSGAHPYMLSLVGSLIERDGLVATEKWAKGMVANMAMSPRGGDTDQIKAVASGECSVTLVNTYYFARMMKSDKSDDMLAISKVGFVWPNQLDGGVHINISGGGMARNAPHPKEAVQFLEYLASDSAQEYLANGNNEWPTVSTVKVDNPAFKSMGNFQVEKVPVAAIGKNQIAAQKLLDQAGYK